MRRGRELDLIHQVTSGEFTRPFREAVSAFQQFPVLGKTLEHLDNVTAGRCDFQPVRARVLDHCPVQLARQTPALGFPRNPRVVDLDVASPDLAVGHDGLPADGEFTVDWRLRVFNFDSIAAHVGADQT